MYKGATFSTSLDPVSTDLALPLQPPEFVPQLAAHFSTVPVPFSDSPILAHAFAEAASAIATNPDGCCSEARQLELLNWVFHFILPDNNSSPELISACFSVLDAFASGGRASITFLEERRAVSFLCSLARFSIPPLLKKVFATLHILFSRFIDVSIAHSVTVSEVSDLMLFGHCPYDPVLTVLFAEVCSDIVSYGQPNLECADLIAASMLLMIGPPSTGWTNAEMRALFDCVARLVSLTDFSGLEFLNEWMPAMWAAERLPQWSEENVVGIFGYFIEFADRVGSTSFLREFRPEQVLAFRHSKNPEVVVRALTVFALLMQERLVDYTLIENDGVNAVVFEVLQSESFEAKAMALRYFHAFGSVYGWPRMPAHVHLRYIEAALDIAGSGAPRETLWCLEAIIAGLESPGPELVAGTIQLIGESNARGTIQDLQMQANEAVARAADAILQRIPAI
jgi:hypothetical protein